MLNLISIDVSNCQVFYLSTSEIHVSSEIVRTMIAFKSWKHSCETSLFPSYWHHETRNS